MRRSVREAIVGFSLLAAIAGAGGFWFWLRGISLASQHLDAEGELPGCRPAWLIVRR